MFTLINSANLNVELDPVETIESQRPSVAFNIVITWTTTFQRTKIEIKEHWLEYFELNQFQEHLQHFIEKQNDLVKLGDMPFEPVLQLNRVDENIYFEVKCEAQFPMGAITLKTEIEDDEVVEILERMRTWAKWW